ncbi:MAG: diguanylate cyclase domain-containing protein [Rhodocyclaceae bacterium]
MPARRPDPAASDPPGPAAHRPSSVASGGRHSALGRRLLFWILFISFFNALAAMSVQLYLDYRRDLADMEGMLAFVRDSQLPSLAQAAWNFDRPQLATQLAGIAASPWVLSVSIRYGPRESSLLSAGEPVGPQQAAEHYVLQYPVGDDVVEVGSVDVVPNLAEVHRRTRERIAVVLATQAVKVAIISFSLLWLVSLLITRHLRRLAAFARAFVPGQPMRPFELRRGRPEPRDELYDLVASLNDAYARLDAAHVAEQARSARLETEIAERTRETEAARERLELSLQGGRLATWEWNVVDGSAAYDDAWYTLLGYVPGEFPQTYQSFERLVHPDDLAAVENAALLHLSGGSEFYEVDMRMRARDGTWRWIHAGGRAVDRDVHGRGMRMVGIHQDITPLKLYQRQLEQLAHHDTLTALPNRSLLADRLEQAMVASQRRGTQLALVYIDLDGFKAVNDTYGHEIGDALLIAVTRRLQNALREGDTLARVGGDEFVALLADLPSQPELGPVLGRLLEAAAAPVVVRERSLGVSASIGVAMYPQHADDADSLLRLADQAMYTAKMAGKNRYRISGA